MIDARPVGMWRRRHCDHSRARRRVSRCGRCVALRCEAAAVAGWDEPCCLLQADPLPSTRLFPSFDVAAVGAAADVVLAAAAAAAAASLCRSTMSWTSSAPLRVRRRRWTPVL